MVDSGTGTFGSPPQSYVAIAVGIFVATSTTAMDLSHQHEFKREIGTHGVPLEVRSHTENGGQEGQGPSQHVSELRRLSGLTWAQLAEMLGVSRRTLHFWASGQNITSENHRLLMDVLGVVRKLCVNGAQSTRTLIFTRNEHGETIFERLQQRQFTEAIQIAQGIVYSDPTTTGEHTYRDNPPAASPVVLANASQENVHQNVVRGKGVKVLRKKRNESA